MFLGYLAYKFHIPVAILPNSFYATQNIPLLEASDIMVRIYSMFKKTNEVNHCRFSQHLQPKLFAAL
jgi:hypothetical protein